MTEYFEVLKRVQGMVDRYMNNETVQSTINSEINRVVPANRWYYQK